MAKLKAPLFSLSASGSLAKTLVYFNWKGINAVREHVVPTNPNTASQQTQRGYMTSALAEFHGATYSADDITAWARLAGAQGLIMTGFNRMVKEFIDEAVAGNTWERITAFGLKMSLTPRLKSTAKRLLVVTTPSAGTAPEKHTSLMPKQWVILVATIGK